MKNHDLNSNIIVDHDHSMTTTLEYIFIQQADRLVSSGRGSIVCLPPTGRGVV